MSDIVEEEKRKFFRPRWLTTTIIYSECLLLSLSSFLLGLVKVPPWKHSRKNIHRSRWKGMGERERERGLTLHYKHKMMPAGLISIYFMWHEADGSWINITWWSSTSFGCGVSPPPPSPLTLSVTRQTSRLQTPILKFGFPKYIKQKKNRNWKRIQDTAELRELAFIFRFRDSARWWLWCTKLFVCFLLHHPSLSLFPLNMSFSRFSVVICKENR